MDLDTARLLDRMSEQEMDGLRGLSAAVRSVLESRQRAKAERQLVFLWKHNKDGQWNVMAIDPQSPAQALVLSIVQTCPAVKMTGPFRSIFEAAREVMVQAGKMTEKVRAEWDSNEALVDAEPIPAFMFPKTAPIPTQEKDLDALGEIYTQTTQPGRNRDLWAR